MKGMQMTMYMKIISNLVNQNITTPKRQATSAFKLDLAYISTALSIYYIILYTGYSTVYINLSFHPEDHSYINLISRVSLIDNVFLSHRNYVTEPPESSS